MKKFWNWVRDETTQERILRLEGAIAEESWFGDDVTPAAFKNELQAGDGPITVWINSPGGDCVAAAQIYNMLMDYPADVTVVIDGIAASAASVIARETGVGVFTLDMAMAGDSYFDSMYHNIDTLKEALG